MYRMVPQGKLVCARRCGGESWYVQGSAAGEVWLCKAVRWGKLECARQYRRGSWYVQGGSIGEGWHMQGGAEGKWYAQGGGVGEIWLCKAVRWGQAGLHREAREGAEIKIRRYRCAIGKEKRQAVGADLHRRPAVSVSFVKWELFGKSNVDVPEGGSYSDLFVAALVGIQIGVAHIPSYVGAVILL